MEFTYQEIARLNQMIGIALMSGEVEFDEGGGRSEKDYSMGTGCTGNMCDTYYFRCGRVLYRNGYSARVRNIVRSVVITAEQKKGKSEVEKEVV